MQIQPFESVRLGKIKRLLPGKPSLGEMSRFDLTKLWTQRRRAVMVFPSSVFMYRVLPLMV